MAGVALGDIHLRFTWPAWHLETSTFVFIFHTPLCRTPPFTHNFHTHTIFHTKLCHIHHCLCRTPSFTYHFVTHNSSHTACFTSRSSTTSFVFPFFPVPATTFVAHYWKKLTCGVILSFNFLRLNKLDQLIN